MDGSISSWERCEEERRGEKHFCSLWYSFQLIFASSVYYYCGEVHRGQIEWCVLSSGQEHLLAARASGYEVVG